jgi:aspartate/methionine/tyrosine aminotransferase
VNSFTPPLPSASEVGTIDDDFFSARTYSAWVRGSMRAAASRPDPTILFGSSVSEPTNELVHILRSAFSPQLTSRYISVFSDGNRYVVDAICARYGVKPECVVTSTGVTSALSMIVKAFVAPGDHVLVERPGFDLLSLTARDMGAHIDYVERPAPDFRFDLSAIKSRLLPTTRLMMITNLNNPTGAHLGTEEIRLIAAELARVDALLVVDEVYSDFTRPYFVAPAATIAENVISTNSLTKVFGLHTLKCGWLISAPEIIGRLQNEMTEGDTGISKLSHAVAAHVLESPEAFDAHWKSILSASRPIMEHHAQNMIAAGLIEGSIPRFGCMYFPKILGVNDTIGLARKLWERYDILVAPGEYFGRTGYIRIGFGGTSPELDKGLLRLHDALRELRPV